MTKDFDVEQIKNKLIELYDFFLKNPKNKENQNSSLIFEREYASIGSLNNYFSVKIVPDIISKAISGLQLIWAYNQDCKILENKKAIKEAEIIVKELKKFNSKSWEEHFKTTR